MNKVALSEAKDDLSRICRSQNDARFLSRVEALKRGHGIGIEDLEK